MKVFLGLTILALLFALVLADGVPPSCEPGELSCGNKCINPMWDNHNCGKCFNKCGSGKECVEGNCQPLCNDNEARCLPNFECTDLISNENNCGACGIRCKANQKCMNGKCANVVMCNPPNTLCGQECVNLKTDENNCGMCGNKCAKGKECRMGKCVPCNC